MLISLRRCCIIKYVQRSLCQVNTLYEIKINLRFHFVCDDLKTAEGLCAAEGAGLFFSESVSTIFADMTESFCMINCRAWCI